MEEVLEKFDQGVSELQLYLRLLRSIERKKTRMRFRQGNADMCFLILKASSFLLMYNIVEFGVRAAFEDVYLALKSDAITYQKAIKEVQEEWLAQAFRNVAPESANKESYVTRTRKLIELVAGAGVLELNARNMSISGNLDADQVRALCKKHRITLRVHQAAFGGGELSTVKDKRNALAHGLVSFSDCGREYSVEDLERIAKRTTSFVRGFIGSAKRYKARSEYRIAA